MSPTVSQLNLVSAAIDPPKTTIPPTIPTRIPHILNAGFDVHSLLLLGNAGLLLGYLRWLIAWVLGGLVPPWGWGSAPPWAGCCRESAP